VFGYSDGYGSDLFDVFGQQMDDGLGFVNLDIFESLPTASLKPFEFAPPDPVAEPNTVLEPPTVALLILAFAGLGFARRRKLH
jgi:hypothetical protein